MDEISEHLDVQQGPRAKLAGALERVEHAYLVFLRAAILILATALLLTAAYLAITGVWKVLQSPSSVKEEVAAVTADELTDAEAPRRPSNPNSKAGQDSTYLRYYTNFSRRYHELFASKFEPYRQPSDKKLSRDEFDDVFVNSAARVAGIASGDIDFEDDKSDLEKMLVVMTKAAELPETKQRLAKYKAAKKVRVARKVDRTRTEYRSGWNRYSTSCEDWYYQPYGCPEQRAVSVPYTETVYSMEFPEGTQSHTEVFRAFEDRYTDLLTTRREANRDAAEFERQEIILGNALGADSLWKSLSVVAGFLVLMFFFLLIAIERHQRRISGEFTLSK